MLQSIREKTSGWIATIVLVLVILAMAVWGFADYITPKVENYAARIEGPPKIEALPFLRLGRQTRDISPEEFRRRFDQVRNQARQEQGEAFDAAAFESRENKRAVMDALVDQTLLAMAAERDKLGLSKTAVQQQILAVDAFRVAGRFDQKQYELVLQGSQTTPAQFEELVKQDMLSGTVRDGIAASGLAGAAELEAYLRLSRQTRDIRFVALPPPPPSAAPTEAEIKAWYDAHAAQYRSPERVMVEYVEVSAAAMPVNAVADEATLRKRYEDVKGRFGTVPRKMASHILFNVPEDATPAVVAAAKAKADAVAAQARQPGADFAALARASSEDIGSKAAGGDLGAFEPGSFGDAFDAAFAALQPGQVSAPVRTPAGWHVIQFRELTAGSTKPFEEVRAELEAEFLETERERAFNDVTGKLVDRIYADPGALAPTAQALQLPVRRSGWFTAATGEGIAALEPVRKAAFQDAQKNDRQVSDTIEVGPNHVVVLRVADHQPAAPIPLATVRARVVADLLADRAAKAARLQAEAYVARAAKGESFDALAAASGQPVSDVPGINREPPSPQLRPLVDAAYRLPRPVAGKAPPVGMARLAPDRYALVTVTAVKDGDLSTLDAKTRADLRQQLASMRGVVEAQAYARSLRKQYTVEVAEDRL
jgi:peptidyl-prolyl cis-trans isomerase D